MLTSHVWWYLGKYKTYISRWLSIKHISQDNHVNVNCGLIIKENFILLLIILKSSASQHQNGLKEKWQTYIMGIYLILRIYYFRYWDDIRINSMKQGKRFWITMSWHVGHDIEHLMIRISMERWDFGV